MELDAVSDTLFDMRLLFDNSLLRGMRFNHSLLVSIRFIKLLLYYTVLGLLISSRGLKGQRAREATGVMYLVLRLRSEMTDVIQAIKDDESLFLHLHLTDS